jgi:hypothetical protein
MEYPLPSLTVNGALSASYFYELLWWTDGIKPINTRTRALVKLQGEEINHFMKSWKHRILWSGWNLT